MAKQLSIRSDEAYRLAHREAADETQAADRRIVVVAALAAIGAKLRWPWSERFDARATARPTYEAERREELSPTMLALAGKHEGRRPDATSDHSDCTTNSARRNDRRR